MNHFAFLGSLAMFMSASFAAVAVVCHGLMGVELWRVVAIFVVTWAVALAGMAAGYNIGYSQGARPTRPNDAGLSDEECV